MKGLLIRSPHIENILSGRKSWEMRSSRTSELNRIIALIKSKSGTVIGTCKIVAVHGPLSREEMERTTDKHLVIGSRIDDTLRHYPKCYAWELAEVVALREPVHYEHPNGAVIWVKLASDVERQIKAQIKDR